MRWPRFLIVPLLVVLAGAAWWGVRERIWATAVAGSATDRVKPVQDHPPHGGTPIVLGDEAFHLELVRDPDAGTLRVYVLDGEMEEFVRVKAPQLDLQAEVDGHPSTLALKAVADPATGETVGDTCLFEGKADWIKRTDHFKGVFPVLAIQDQTFKKVAFDFPEGNGKD